MFATKIFGIGNPFCFVTTEDYETCHASILTRFVFSILDYLPLISYY
jgi:hypothetical protein